MALFEMSRSLWGELRRKKQRRCARMRGRRALGAWAETLEDRLAPAVSTWSGAVDGLWSKPANWDVPPAPGNDLIFPAGAAALSTANDLAAATTFGSITLQASGYAIGGSSIVLTGGVDSSQATGSSAINLPIGFNGPATITVDQPGASLMLGGPISGSNGLTKAGAGLLDLTAPNTYTGTTTVNAGELDIDGNQPGSPVNVAAGATLGGMGTVGTITAPTGKVRPGSTTPAILNDAGDLALGAGSTFTVALNGNTAGAGYSQLAVNGGVNLGGATLDAAAGFTPNGGSLFRIIDNLGTAPVTGTFNGLAEGSPVTISGQPFRISYTGGTGNDVVLTRLAASTTTLNASPTSSAFGEQVTLTATVTGAAGTPTGQVRFVSGTTQLGTGTLINGVATLPTRLLPVGMDQVSAEYQGDATYDASTSSLLPVNVTKANTTTTVNVDPNPSGLGQPVKLTATVASVITGGSTPTGSIEFFNGATSLGTATLTNGTGSISTTVLASGANTITANYTGDANYNAGTSAPVTATVKQAATTTLTPSATSIISGQTITLTAKVVASDSSSSNTPTGNVEFFNGTTSLGTAPVSGDTATLASVTLPAGTDALTARYQGDANFGINTSPPVNVTVAQASTTTAVTAAPNPSSAGQSVMLGATVVVNSPGAGTPTGTVQFFNGTTSLGTATLSGGSATFSTSALPVGANSITAQYLGDANHSGSTSPAITQTVNPGTTATITTVAVSPSPSVTGQAVTLTAGVTATGAGGGIPTGTVEFLNGSTSLGTATLSGGVATLSTTALTVGSSSLTAMYKGDTTFASSTSHAITATVNKASTATTVTAPTSPSQSGQPVTLTANVSVFAPGAGTPTGSVEFFNGTTSLGSVTLTDGTATLTTSALTAGSPSITAQYKGDANFSASTSAAVVPTVTQAGTIVAVTVSNPRPVTMEAVVFTANVAAAGGSTGTPTGTVTFFAGDVNLGSAALSNGTATLTTSAVPVGDQAITAVYQGDNNFNGATSSPQSMVVGDSTELYLNQVYLQILRRPIDQPSLNLAYTLIVTGTPKRPVVRAVMTSNEARAVRQQTGQIVPGISVHVPRGHRGKVERVNQIYQEVLGRPATRRERAIQSRLLTSRHAQESLITRLLSSKEFYVNSSLHPGP